MAGNNPPKHDFAPAWLKIPNQENAKPPGSKPGEAADIEDRLCASYHTDQGVLPISPTRQTHPDYSKRFPSNQSNKFRHHSVDDDYYAYTYGPYGYYNGYGYPEKYGMHYGSQPSLVRSPGQRDSKYQHPHARYGQGGGVNVAAPYPFYDFMPAYEYYGNEGYYGNYPGGGRSSSKRDKYEREGRNNSKEGKDKDEKKETDGEKDKPFTDDFPSLNGGVEKPASKGSKQLNGTGVWDNPPIGKSGSTTPSKSSEESTDSSQPKALRDSNIYKNLVPNKSTIPRRPARMNGSYPREAVSFTGLKLPIPTSSSSNPGFSKETGSQPTTPPMDILNTRFVTQPKTLSDKKSHFLKALRQEDSEKLSDKKLTQKSSDGELENGLDTLGLADNASHLSSSLEAEQRLLREMGWNELDEDEYEITEDEMKEFQNLTKQVQQQQQRNGVVKAIPKPWSPQHIPLYKPNTNELNETLSSSDSDSDDGGS